MKIHLALSLYLLMSMSAFALDEEAERYVKLALELGEYDPDYVDAYLGPDEWALIGEGSANYGVELAFPGSEKIEYERDVLFPLAGLDPEKAVILDKLNKLTESLSHATNATAQLYLDGKITREEAIEQRRKYSLTSRERAEQSVRFIERYRSYVLNYNLGKDLVARYIEEQGDDQATRWVAFERMLTELPSASDMTK